MIKKLFLMVLAFVFACSAIWGGSLSYLYLYADESSQMNKVSYEILNDEVIKSGDVFNLEVYSQGKLIDNECVMDINFEDNTIFKKKICNVPKIEGEYVFVAKIVRDGEVIETETSSELVLEDIQVTQEFVSNENATQVILKFNEGRTKSFVLEQEIPKEVIKLLTEENRDELIISSKEFIIIKEDPLIAWHVEPEESEINFTINKKTTSEEQVKFKLSSAEDSSFKIVKYSMFVLILFLLMFLFKGVILKKRK
ncbi:MAG: hypothetical protein ACOCXG_04640 [Nanoarchaeota archaeon]